MVTTYNHPWMSFEDQVELLTERGLVVTDNTAALDYLDRLGYYRLSAYWYPFRDYVLEATEGTRQINVRYLDKFVKNAKFQDAVELYVFDKKLRLLALDALERIEVAVRVDIAYLLGKRDPFAYENPTELHGNFSRQNNRSSKHERWLSKYQSILERSSEEFVAHYKQTYGFPLPIWVAIELWDFGLLSWFFGGMKYLDKESLAEKYGVGSGQAFGSWIRGFNYVRNICAHHSRLWNRNMVERPMMSNGRTPSDFDHFVDRGDLLARPFVFFCMMQLMMKQICPSSSWGTRVKELLGNFPDPCCGRASVSDIGTIEGWESWELWK